MLLPAYPIVTVDPHFSIWSKAERLTAEDTKQWYGQKKRIEGTLTVDSETYRFLGNGEGTALFQVSENIEPYISTYTFENSIVRLKLRTWSPFIFSDLHLFSLPVAFLDTEVEVLDGTEHSISVKFTAFDELCYNNNKKQITKYTDSFENTRLAKMGCTKQTPLKDSGDEFSADWGYYAFMGGECTVCKEGITTKSRTVYGDKLSFNTVIGYDDVYSIEYFGEQLKGLWTEKFKSINEGMKYCLDNREDILAKLTAQQNTILSDSEKFGKDYQNILTAAARQVLAAHKLVRNGKGQLLYMSKECHSNGCINTVDVSYPAMPMYLIYTPELVKAMLVGIFEFANMSLWTADFAPHDIGRYPIANGQVYALNVHNHLLPHSYTYRKVYKSSRFGMYMPQFQMPVEECGNMILLTYAYYMVSGDTDFLKENAATLKKWADYLIMKGVVLDNQLCTDDFAGHSKKNVNLAIKAVMGIAAYSKIADLLGEENTYMAKAKEYADELVAVCGKGTDFLPFSVDKKDSWSLKYNLVWDILFDFNLFDKAIYKAESEKYRIEMNTYGTPLDYRRTFTKTDWELWAACLDETGENIGLFSKCICDYLADTKDRNCFSDWVETKEPKQSGFDHRTVQAGLWMPVLFSKFGKF